MERSLAEIKNLMATEIIFGARNGSPYNFGSALWAGWVLLEPGSDTGEMEDVVARV